MESDSARAQPLGEGEGVLDLVLVGMCPQVGDQNLALYKILECAKSITSIQEKSGQMSPVSAVFPLSDIRHI